MNFKVLGLFLQDDLISLVWNERTVTLPRGNNGRSYTFTLYFLKTAVSSDRQSQSGDDFNFTDIAGASDLSALERPSLPFTLIDLQSSSFDFYTSNPIARWYYFLSTLYRGHSAHC